MTHSCTGRAGLWLALLSGLLLAAPVRAQSGDAEESAVDVDPEDAQRLEQLSTQLASPDAEVRRAAFDAMTTLPASMVPAIAARIEELRSPRPPGRWPGILAHRFRQRSNGGPGESEDLALGALAELGQDHREREHVHAVQMAETLFLWRALQRIGTHEAHQAALPIVGLDGGEWLPEARNWVRREGPKVMALAIEARTGRGRSVRSWGQWAMRELGADNPGRAVHSLDEAQLADVITAYAGLRLQGAMRVIVSYVGSERRRVRRAARGAMRAYGGNAIWILRTAYRNETGEHPPRAWGWQRVSTELFALTDSRRMAPVRAALEAGDAARERGDLAAMAREYDAVMVRAPELDEGGARVAEGYAALARSGSDVARAYRRALRIAPEHSEAAAWRSELALFEAESLRNQGVLDRGLYERILEHQPEQAQATAALAAAAPASLDAPEDPRSRWALAGAALLGLLGLGLLWRGPSERSEQTPSDESLGEAATIDAPFELDAAPPHSFADLSAFDAADSTLVDSTLG